MRAYGNGFGVVVGRVGCDVPTEPFRRPASWPPLRRHQVAGESSVVARALDEATPAPDGQIITLVIDESSVVAPGLDCDEVKAICEMGRLGRSLRDRTSESGQIPPVSARVSSAVLSSGPAVPRQRPCKPSRTQVLDRAASVALLQAQGASTAEIAERLGLSVHAVRQAARLVVPAKAGGAR